MIAIMDVTPVNNVKNGTIVDAKAINTLTYNWDDCVLVFDVTKNSNQKVEVANVSLFDHRLVDAHNGELYMILGMLSK